MDIGRLFLTVAVRGRRHQCRIPEGRTTVWPRGVSCAVPCGYWRSFGGPPHVVSRVIPAPDDRCREITDADMVRGGINDLPAYLRAGHHGD